MANPNHSKHIRWLVYLAVCLLLTLTVVISEGGAGRWVREDTLSSADVVVALSGSMPYRGEEAARLFKMVRRPKYG